MKVAKLEIKMILVLMLVRYEYTLVDSAGKPPKQLPKPNRNDIHQVRLFFCLRMNAVLTCPSSSGQTSRRNLFSSVQKVNWLVDLHRRDAMYNKSCWNFEYSTYGSSYITSEWPLRVTDQIVPHAQSFVWLSLRFSFNWKTEYTWGTAVSDARRTTKVVPYLFFNTIIRLFFLGHGILGCMATQVHEKIVIR